MKLLHLINSYVCMSTCYSLPSRFLLRGAPDYSVDTESEFHAEAHEQLRVKDLPRVPTRQLEVDSNPLPSGCKAPNMFPASCVSMPLPQRHRDKTCVSQIGTMAPGPLWSLEKRVHFTYAYHL